MEELRAEASRQLDRYNELWSTHRTLLEEAQTLRSQVIALKSGSRGRVSEDGSGARTVTPRDLVPDLGARFVSQGDRPIMLRALIAGMRDLGGGLRTKAVAVGGAKRAYPSFCTN